MKFKTSIALIGLFALQLISSCCRSVKYYDFSGMTVQVSSPTLAPTDTLRITLSAVDIQYMAYNLPKLGFDEANALSCDDGWGGMKYPFNAFEITSTAHFNEAYPANEDLSALFQIRRFIGNGQFDLIPLQDANFSEIRTLDMELILPISPTLDKSHRFTIKMVKSNQEEIVVETDVVSWQ